MEVNLFLSREVCSLPTTPSPLRYPGGKAKLYKYVKEILDLNNLHGTYIEPFAGGAGLAIKLLLNNDVKRIVINDSDSAIYSFWQCVLYHTDELCQFIETVPITYDEWLQQRAIYLNQSQYSEIEIGKAAFFLNRTNVSGIFKGGIIGGKDQTGASPMFARFNRAKLIQKINRIAACSDKIDVYNLDALDFLSPQVMRRYYKVLINFDPPYVEKGGKLYMNYFTEEDHRKLRDAIAKCSRKWIVTYDVCELTASLYKSFRGSFVNITYSAHGARKSKEYIFFSNNLIIPSNILLL